MKKILFAILLLAVSAMMWANEPYVLRHLPSHDTLAVFQPVDNNPYHIAAEVSFTEDINCVEITQYLGVAGTGWWGPDWENYSSTKSDAAGYCWWTCPDFVDGKVKTPIGGGSGTHNHIGIIMPKGRYRFSFLRSASEGNCFMIIEL